MVQRVNAPVLGINFQNTRVYHRRPTYFEMKTNHGLPNLALFYVFYSDDVLSDAKTLNDIFILL